MVLCFIENSHIFIKRAFFGFDVAVAVAVASLRFVRLFVCYVTTCGRHCEGGGGSSKNCMRQRAASNSYDYHNLYGLGDLRQAAAAAASAALGRATTRTRTRTKAKETENREQKEQLLKTEQESREEIFCCVAGDVFRAASCFSNACGAHGAAHLTNAKYVDLGTPRHLRVLKITYIYTEGSESKRGKVGRGPLS